jgi:hypothetical protein
VFAHGRILNGQHVSRPSDRLPGKPQAEALDEAGDAVGIHLQRVARAELRERLRRGRGGAAQVDELLEVALEAGRGDDLEDPRRLIARVPERVPLVARLVDQIARAGDDDLVPEQCADLPLQDVAVLVLEGVPV